MSGEKKGGRRRAHHGQGGHGGGHHGGAWKVAYADFTTAMMAFFMLMWILAATSPEQKKAIAQYFRSEGPFKDGGSSLTGSFSGGPGLMANPVHNAIVEESTALEMAAQGMQEALNEGLEDGSGAGQGEGEGEGEGEGQGEGTGEAGGEGGSEVSLGDMKDQVSITLGDDGLVIEITDDAQQELFGVGSAKMNPVFEQTLDAIAANLKGLKNRVRIEGYTDARPYPTGVDYSNWELSSDRANAARRRLEERGLARDRFESVVGYGDGRLAAPASPLAPANRRITITVLRDHPLPPAGSATGEGAVPKFRPFGETVEPSTGTPRAGEHEPAHPTAPDSAPTGAAGHDHTRR
ncbi:MAG: OmpA family protein [bacterium]|nr:OmpA family protein [bacterium]